MLKPKKVYIPENLNLREINNGVLDRDIDIDRMHYFLNLIHEQRILYKKNEYVPLKAVYLRKFMRDHKIYTTFLRDKKIIDCDDFYVKTHKSYGYKLLSPYDKSKVKAVEIYSKNLQKKISEWQKNRLPNTRVHRHLYSWLNQIEINFEEAEKEIELYKQPEHNSAIISINKFLDKDFYLYKDDYGRVHTNLTVIKSSLRRFLTYKGSPLITLDIINSQPILILYLYNTLRCAVSRKPLPDLSLYKLVCEAGKLYDFVMERTGELDRKIAKERFFRETLFGKRVAKDFETCFPTVASFIRDVKKRDYRRLAWMMQKVESDIVINRICRKIMETHPDLFISTIHDSVVTTEGGVGFVKKCIQGEFNKIGLNPSIRID